MSEININDLPREMITQIFRSLDVVNLKKATLVCKLWNNLIENACRWSLWLNYDYNSKLTYHDNEQKMNFILSTNRKFEAIVIIRGILNKNDQIHKIFQRHGFNVVELMLHECRMDNQTALAELLNLTPNLRHADIQRIKFCGLTDVPLNQFFPDLKKLKTLKMWDSDRRIVECFQKSKLRTMSIEGFHQRSDHCGLLVDFLLRQEMLTSLQVSTYFLSQSLLVEMGKSSVPIPFRLTQLNITYMEEDEGDALDNLLKFVKSQAESLTEIEMNCIRNIASSLLVCVFAMPKLNTLALSVNKIPQNKNGYERLKENCSVRTLKLYDDWFVYDNCQCLVNFLKKLPNIRSLILPYFHIEHALIMVRNLTKLESLSIREINDVRSIDYARFSNLKALHINYLTVKINWNEFTKFHSRLNELLIVNVKEPSYLNSDDIDQITTNVDLQLIRLGVGFVADEQFFEIIRTKCTNLKILDVHKSCVSLGPSYNVGINVLRLCDDFKFLNVFPM